MRVWDTSHLLDTVPAGNVARSTSMGDLPGARSPDTCEVMCMTWL